MKELNTENLINEKYNRDKLDETWSESNYDKYEYAPWDFHDFPLINNRETFTEITSISDGSILEIGCAMGAAYKFLSNKGVVNKNSKYVGMDISNKAINFNKKNYINAEWRKTDLTTYEFQERFDYVFERIAVHHMENPLAVFSKLMDITNKSFSCQFVSCLKGKTISDLSVARYRHEAGQLVYFNIINLFEVIELALEKGFNVINVLYHGSHEKVGNNPISHQYLSPEVDINKRMIGRCTVNFSKVLNQKLSMKLLSKRSKNDRTINIKKFLYMADNSHRKYIRYFLERMEDRGSLGGILFTTNMPGEDYV